MSQLKAGSGAAQLQTTDDLFEIYRRSGRPEDFELVVSRYAALVFSECRRVARNAHDAEDAAQLAFLALAIELRSGSEIKRPAGWLQRVARRQALKIVRSRGRRRRREDAARKPDSAPIEVSAVTADADRAQTAALIRDAIDALPERHRLPVVLHYFGGMTLDAIAGELGLTKTAVGTRLHRARKLLGERLGERGLTFNAGELSAYVAMIVPAAVVATIAKSSGTFAMGLSGGFAASASSATFALGVTQMLTAAGSAVGTRPLAAAAAAMLCLAGTSVAWVGPRTWIEVIRHPLDVRQWLERVFDARPNLNLHVNRGFSTAEPQHRPLINVDAFASDLGDNPLARAFAEAPASPYFAPPTASVAQTLSTPVKPVPKGQPDLTSARAIAPAHVAPPATDPLAAPRDIATASPEHLTLADAWIGSPDAPAMTIGAGQLFHFGILNVDSDVGATVVQTGGDVTANRLVVGDRGRGTYDLSGGGLHLGGLTIGVRPTSDGVLSVGNGRLDIQNPDAPITVGDRGSGQLLLGTASAPGHVTIVNGTYTPVIIRANASGQGLVQGWGSISSAGTLVNNGRVVADGFGHSRALDFSQVAGVTNTIDNTPDGTNGWYARRGGRVELPSIPVAKGTHTYTWGENPKDPTIDLVNSVRLTAHNQPTATTLAIDLRSLAAADPIDVPLPSGMSTYGLWSFTSASFNPTSIDVQVRYDHLAAQYVGQSAGSGEYATRLVAYQSGSWLLATSASVDLTDHIVSGVFDGSFRYLAVGIVWTTFYDGSRSSTASVSSYFRPETIFVPVVRTSVTPEPTMAVSLAAFALLTRRRRR